MLVKVVGFDLLQRSINKKMNQLKHRKAVNAQATILVDRWIQKNFESGGKRAMGGSGWRKLSDQTMSTRRKGRAMEPLSDGKPQKPRSDRILIDTGQLKSKWKHLWTPGLAKVQSGVDYAEQHHYGTPWLPVRRILPTDAQIRPKLEKLFSDYIRRVLGD